MNGAIPASPPLELLASAGQMAFVGVYVVVGLCVLLMPPHLAGYEAKVPLGWKNPRVWALVICGIQILVYWILG